MVHEACDEAASLIARYFLDSSALVKRYHRESGSPDVDQLLAAPDNQIIISRLALVELHSSFARLVRKKKKKKRGQNYFLKIVLTPFPC